MTNLPEDIILLIFDYLDIGSLYKLSYTCKYFYNIRQKNYPNEIKFDILPGYLLRIFNILNDVMRKDFIKYLKKDKIVVFLTKNNYFETLKLLYDDNIISYDEYKKILYECCRNGNIVIAKWLFSLNEKINIEYDYDNAFRICCENGNLEFAKWLYTINNKININDQDDYAFRVCCEKGYLEFAKWLYTINDKININEYDDYAFRVCCGNGYLEIAKWLYTINDKIDINEYSDYAFRSCCEYGHTNVAKWLISLGKKIDIHANGEYAFGLSCENNHIETAKWLVSLEKTNWIDKYNIIHQFNKINIHEDEEYAFRQSCEKGSIDIVLWLLSLKDTHGAINIHSKNHDTTYDTNDLLPKHIIDKHEIAKEIDNSKEIPFIASCTNGHRNIAELLLSLENAYGKINIHESNDFAFRQSCAYNHIDIVKWLLSLEKTYGKINIHACNDYAFRIACYKGNSELVKLLLALDHIDIYVRENKAILSCCKNNNCELLKIILNLIEDHEYNKKSKISNKTKEKLYKKMFEVSCTHGNFNNAKLLYNDYSNIINIDNENNDYIFRICCQKNYFEIAKWLISVLNINIHSYYDYAFKKACMKGHYDIAKWLFHIGNCNSEIGKINIGFDSSIENKIYPLYVRKSPFYIKKWIKNINLINIDIANTTRIKK